MMKRIVVVGWSLAGLRGVLGVNMPKLVMPFRALIAAKATWSEALPKAASLSPAFG